MTLIKKVEEFIANNQLFNEQNHLIVGVSGGIDSMVLCHMLNAMGYHFSMAHVNYNLRGKESLRDEAFVKQQAKKMGVSVFVKNINTLQLIKTIKQNLQETAREERYKWFNELCGNNKNTIICTAHHLNDSIETTLFNLIRGAALNGLTGIKTKHKNIVRPLLCCTRAEIELYAKTHKIKFVTDSSNKTTKYTRNLIRHKIIPVLERINPEVINQINQTQKALIAQQYFYNLKITELKKTLVKVKINGFVINAIELLKQKYPSYLLYEFIAGHGFNLLQCNAIIKALRNKQTGKVFYAKDFSAYINRNELLVKENPNQLNLEPVVISALPFKLKINQIWYAFSLVKNTPDFIFEPNKLYVDADQCNLPFSIETIAAGDKFSPLGMTGKKKISDFLIDKKISLPDKQAARKLIVNKKIAALLPYQIDNAFRITQNTENILVIYIKRGD
jgi:tRNA(Ile)-lysidine synthase